MERVKNGFQHDMDKKHFDAEQSKAKNFKQCSRMK